MIGIYKITSPTNKVYIGQSVNIEKRWQQHKRDNNSIIGRSLKKHGVNNHNFEVIEECAVELLNERERYWQDYYDCVKNGLNCKTTSTSDKTGYLSDETKSKISKSKIGVITGKLHPMWGVRRFGKDAPRWGKPHTEESKLKISLSKKGKYTGYENPFYGKKHTKEYKDNHSENRMLSLNPNSKRVFCESNGLYFNSLKEASISMNIPYSSLKAMLYGRMKNKIKIKYLDN